MASKVHPTLLKEIESLLASDPTQKRLLYLHLSECSAVDNRVLSRAGERLKAFISEAGNSEHIRPAYDKLHKTLQQLLRDDHLAIRQAAAQLLGSLAAVTSANDQKHFFG